MTLCYKNCHTVDNILASTAKPRVWNSDYSLPTDLRQPDFAYSRFRQSLKTFLFGQSEPKGSVNPPFNCALEIQLLTYSTTYSRKQAKHYLVNNLAALARSKLAKQCHKEILCYGGIQISHIASNSTQKHRHQAQQT